MAPHYPISIKIIAIELYNQGYGSTAIAKKFKIPPTTIQRWINKHHKFKHPLNKQPKTKFKPEFKTEIVRQILQNLLSCKTAALKYNVSRSSVESWVRQVKTNGYDQLYANNPNGQPPKTMPRGRPKKQEPQTEIEKLKVELERLKTENALLKKVMALVEQQEAQMRKIAKTGLKPSKN